MHYLEREYGWLSAHSNVTKDQRRQMDVLSRAKIQAASQANPKSQNLHSALWRQRAKLDACSLHDTLPCSSSSPMYLQHDPRPKPFPEPPCVRRHPQLPPKSPRCVRFGHAHNAMPTFARVLGPRSTSTQSDDRHPCVPLGFARAWREAQSARGRLSSDLCTPPCLVAQRRAS